MPRNIISLSILCLFCLTSSVFARSADLESQFTDVVKCLQEQVSKNSKDLSKSKNVKNNSRLKRSDAPKEDVNIALQRENFEISKSLRVVQSWMSQYTNDAASILNLNVESSAFINLPALCSKLISELEQEIQVEKQVLIDQFENEFSEIQSVVSNTLLMAKEVSEIDPLFVQLTHFSSTINPYRSLSHMREKVRKLLSIVETWQDYMNSVANRDEKGAERKLSSLLKLVSNTPVIERSEILKRQNNLTDTIREAYAQSSGTSNSVTEVPVFDLTDVLASIRSPEDLAGAREKLRLMTLSRKASNEVNRQIPNVNALISAKKSTDQGDPVGALIYLSELQADRRSQYWVDPIKNQLMVEAVRAIVPKGYELDEAAMSLNSLYTSTVSQMRENEDWEGLLLFAKVLQSTAAKRRGASIPTLKSDIKGVEKFLLAERYRSTKQWAKSVEAYNDIFALNGWVVPHEEAKSAVEYIQKNHKEELVEDQKLEAQISTQKASTYDPRMRMRSLNRDRRRSMMEDVVPDSPNVGPEPNKDSELLKDAREKFKKPGSSPAK